MVETKEVYFNDRPPETRFYWHTSLYITNWSNIRIFEYSMINHGFDSTNLWTCMVWQIHDSSLNIRIFGFDRVKIPFTGIIASGPWKGNNVASNLWFPSRGYRSALKLQLVESLYPWLWQSYALFVVHPQIDSFYEWIGRSLDDSVCWS